MPTIATRQQKYNGWPNYETWNVSLWLNNDEPTYREFLSQVRFLSGKGLNKREIVDRLAKQLRSLFSDGTPDFTTNLRRVRWHYIARSFYEDHA